MAHLVVVELSSTFDICKVSRQRDSELDRLGFITSWTVLALDASRSPLALRCLLLHHPPLLRWASDVGGCNNHIVATKSALWLWVCVLILSERSSSHDHSGITSQWPMGRKDAVDVDGRLALPKEVGSLLLASCSGICSSLGSCTWASDAFWQPVRRL